MLSFSDTDWKNYGHLSNIFGPGSPNWFLREQKYILSLEEIWEKNIFSLSLSAFGRKVFDVIFKNTFYESRETLPGYLLLLKNWHFLVTFTDSVKKFRTSGKIFLAWLPELHSTRPLRHIEEKNAIWRTFTFFYLFQTIGDYFCPCGKNFQHSCQNCFRRANWHTLGKTIFSEQNKGVILSCLDLERSFSGLMAKHFWLLAMFFSAGLTKFSSTCPRKQFEGFFSSERIISCWPFRTLIE